jgi:hypothetical protein
LEVTFKLTTQNHHIKTEYAISTELKNLGIENPTIQDVSKSGNQYQTKQITKSCGNWQCWKFL